MRQTISMLPTRTPLALLPTPIHKLAHISRDLGIDLWIKRDDLTGFALGGNKGRKLEYLMSHILGSKSQAVVTCGALQSNFVRQLAAACSVFGIECHAVVMDLPFDAAAGKPIGAALGKAGGNVFLDQVFNAQLHRVEDGDWSVLYACAEDLANHLEKAGHNVYRIPVGGSSPLGGYAFYVAANELEGQPHFDSIVVCTSSGSTQAGLEMGLRGKKTRLIGIAADSEPDMVDDVLRVSHGLSELLQTPKAGPEDFEIHTKWADPGYGVPSEAGNQAIRMLAQKEGILLDPIYTGKAFAGLIDLAKAGEIRGRVLFWHTGGVPTLFALGQK